MFTLTQTIHGGGGNKTIRTEQVFEAEGNIVLDVDVAAEATRMIPVAFRLADVAFFALTSDQPLEVLTNHPSIPDDTLMLEANQPLIWHPVLAQPCPVSHDVTLMILRNKNDEGVTLRVRIGLKIAADAPSQPAVAVAAVEPPVELEPVA